MRSLRRNFFDAARGRSSSSYTFNILDAEEVLLCKAAMLLVDSLHLSSHTTVELPGPPELFTHGGIKRQAGHVHSQCSSTCAAHCRQIVLSLLSIDLAGESIRTVVERRNLERSRLASSAQ